MPSKLAPRFRECGAIFECIRVNDKGNEMKTVDYILPECWLPYLVNGDEFEDDNDNAALAAFIADGVARHGRFWCLGPVDDEGNGFMRYHDAREYGVGSCDTVTVRFDVDRV